MVRGFIDTHQREKASTYDRATTITRRMVMSQRNITRRSFLTISAMTTMAMALDWKSINAYAAKMGPKENYPTVVIGAGLGGLCCAAHLARHESGPA